jgi:hypothetical protein
LECNPQVLGMTNQGRLHFHECGKSKWDYLKAIYLRYKKASKPIQSRILDEFC